MFKLVQKLVLLLILGLIVRPINGKNLKNYAKTNKITQIRDCHQYSLIQIVDSDLNNLTIKIQKSIDPYRSYYVEVSGLSSKFRNTFLDILFAQQSEISSDDIFSYQDNSRFQFSKGKEFLSLLLFQKTDNEFSPKSGKEYLIKNSFLISMPTNYKVYAKYIKTGESIFCFNITV